MSESVVLALSGVLGVEGIENLLGQLRAHIQAASGSGPIQVDLAGVTEVDTAALQVFIAARRSAEQAGRPLLFTAANETLRNRLRLTGLEYLCR
ncbi:MAG: STAS domain-containing protein [Magnetococcus sp. YQC-3]